MAEFYDRFTDLYLELTGDFIQTFRSQDCEVLMEYVRKSAGIADGEQLLDAGCGVAAASIWLAQRLPKVSLQAVTISSRQAAIATSRVVALGLDERIGIQVGDYHQLAQLFAEATFDGVMFLESLGHSHDVNAVIAGVAKVLRPGGWLYIKDFFRRETIDAKYDEKSAEVIRLIDETYAYNTLCMGRLITALLQHGFSVEKLQQPQLDTSIDITIAFEDRAGLKTYPAFLTHHAVEWFEIRARKLI